MVVDGLAVVLVAVVVGEFAPVTVPASLRRRKERTGGTLIAARGRKELVFLRRGCHGVVARNNKEVGRASPSLPYDEQVIWIFVVFGVL